VLGVVGLGLGIVLAQARLGRLGGAAGIFAAQDAIGLALLDPALRVGGAQGVERVGAVEHHQDLAEEVRGGIAVHVFPRLEASGEICVRVTRDFGIIAFASLMA
jgi:hypothetical protein